MGPTELEELLLKLEEEEIDELDSEEEEGDELLEELLLELEEGAEELCVPQTTVRPPQPQ